MSLIIATGSNLGDSYKNLNKGLHELSQHFRLIAKSNIYTSSAVEYENQPDFYNQVLEFEIPKLAPAAVMDLLLNIEEKLGRVRDIPKGPRTIDIDIIFWGLSHVNQENLTIPHPAWNQRSFVIYPLQELPFFQTIKNHFDISSSLDNEAYILNK
ncbi:MAG: 2-amino-4-hydroxy-6-hydroxymethyldihydropteridine diphosphokinase [Halobacteriovoraceae bacterium]|jgi:2-amino-4-hydroxy-6-hydroxymethyldihydropteridine diphosphokinase|nr:2-amino-4-hydroxy-6-hydroxymethyldihydropteridine diphosphokinase [Halobacteriovoraceae bacterium]